VSTGPPSVKAASEAPAGSTIPVEWTGPNGQGDFVTIVTKGTTAWTAEDYFYTTEGSPAKPERAVRRRDLLRSGTSTARTRPSLARQEITLTAVQRVAVGALIRWSPTRSSRWAGSAPNGAGDYVTIVKADATQWTNEDLRLHDRGIARESSSRRWSREPTRSGTSSGPIGRSSPGARSPSPPPPPPLTRPDSVLRGTTFAVAWTGPNGPGDFYHHRAHRRRPRILRVVLQHLGRLAGPAAGTRCQRRLRDPLHLPARSTSPSRPSTSR
jgi:Ca-activated chloride channel family protein